MQTLRLCTTVCMNDRYYYPWVSCRTLESSPPAASYLLQKTGDTNCTLQDISSPFLPTLHASLHFRFRWLIPSRDGASQGRWKRNSSRLQPNSTSQGMKHNSSPFGLTSIVFLTGCGSEKLFEHSLSELNCIWFYIRFSVNSKNS